MQEQRDKARSAWAGSGEAKVKPVYKETASGVKKPVFTGYDTLQDNGQVLAIIKGDKKVIEAHEGDEVEIILDRTPFYAESGGQVGDTGDLLGEATKFSVDDTAKPFEELIVHKGKLRKGSLKAGDTVLARVDGAGRRILPGIILRPTCCTRPFATCSAIM